MECGFIGKNYISRPRDYSPSPFLKLVFGHMAYFRKVELTVRGNVFDSQKDWPILRILRRSVGAIVNTQTVISDRTRLHGIHVRLTAKNSLQT